MTLIWWLLIQCNCAQIEWRYQHNGHIMYGTHHMRSINSLRRCWESLVNILQPPTKIYGFHLHIQYYFLQLGWYMNIFEWKSTSCFFAFLLLTGNAMMLLENKIQFAVYELYRTFSASKFKWKKWNQSQWKAALVCLKIFAGYSEIELKFQNKTKKKTINWLEEQSNTQLSPWSSNLQRRFHLWLQ